MSSGFFLRRRGVVRGSPPPLSSCFSPARCPSAAALRWTAAPSTSAIWPRSRQPHQLVTPTSSVRRHFLGAAGTLIHTRRHPHYASGQPEQQQEKKEREDFVRSYLHLLAQEAFFFDDETWQVLGVHHVPGSDRVHVEAIPEDAEYIGFPAFKFVFSFDPALGKHREGNDDQTVPGSDEAKLVKRLRELEAARGLTVTCVGCYAFSKGNNKFFLLSPGLVEEETIEEECDPLFYRGAQA